MSFADDAIGFYLQLDDQLTPALETAGRSYGRFVKSLDVYNRQAFKSVNKGMGALAQVVEGFNTLPQKAVDSYDSALKELRKRVKPIIQTFKVEFSAKTEKTFGRAIAGAIAKVLKDVTLRLGATIPLKKNKYFDTTRNLRELYKEQAQPPDMRGKFQGIPRFAEGGMVTGGSGSIDDVLALLSKGEMVLPADVAKHLQDIAGKSNTSAVAKSIAAVQNLDLELRELKDAAELGLDPSAPSKYRKKIKALGAELGNLTTVAGAMGAKDAKKLIPVLKEIRSKTDEWRESGEDVKGVFTGVMEKVLGPVQFLALSRAIEGVTGQWGEFKGAAQGAYGEVAGGEGALLGFNDSLNEVNIKLQLSRDQLTAMKGRLLDISNQSGGLLDEEAIGQAAKAFVDADVSSREFIENNVVLVAKLSKAYGIEMGATAAQVYKLRDSYKLSEADTAAYYASLSEYSKIANVSTETLATQTAENLEFVGAQFERLGKSPEEVRKGMEGLAKVTAATASSWGDSGGALSKMISEAYLDPSSEAMHTLMQMGVSVQDVNKAIDDSDPSALLNNMATGLNNLTANEPLLARLQEIVPFEGTAEEFVKFAKSGPAVQTMLKDLDGVTVKAADGAKALTQAVDNQTTGWEQIKNSVGTFISSTMGAGMLEFFEEFNIQAALSTLELIKISAQFAIAGAKGLWYFATQTAGLAKMAAGYVLAGAKAIFFKTATTGATASLQAGGGLESGVKGITKSVGGLGKSISSIGKGLGDFIAGIGKGVGQAIAGVFQGISTGLMVLAPALVAFGAAMIGPGAIGFAALVIAVLAVAVAMKIAEPVLMKFMDAMVAVVGVVGDVFVKIVGIVANAMVSMVQALTSMSVDQMVGLVVMFAGMAATLPIIALTAPLAGVGMLALGAGVLMVAEGLFILSTVFTDFDSIVQQFGQIVRGVMGKVMGVVEGLGAVVRKVADGILSAFDGVWGAVKGTLGKVWSAVTAVFGGIWDGISAVVGGIGSALSWVGGIVSDVFGAVVSAVSVAFKWVVGAVKTAFGYVVKYVQWHIDIVVGIFDGIVAVVDTVVGGIGSAFQWVGGVISDAFDLALGAVEWQIDAVSSAFSSLGSAASSVATSIGTAFTWVVDTLAGAFDGVIGTFKSGLNLVLSGVNSMIGMINNMVNAISFTADIPVVGEVAFSLRDLIGNFDTIPMMAQGGIVTQPTLALIGEAGPEVVVPLSDMVSVAEDVQRGELEQVMTQPVVPSAEIQKVITVQLEGFTDKEVHAATMETNALLRQIIAGGGGAIRTKRPVAKKPSDFTTSLAGG